MNTNDTDRDDAPLDANLRLQLRGLRRDLEPDADLWPVIAARIAATPQQAAQASPARRSHRSHGNARRFAPWALAASLVLVAGVAWKLQPPSPGTPASAASIDGPMFDRQAEAMTREYQAALREIEASAPATAIAAHPEQAALRELDHSAKQIRTALERDPDARFLLDRLRKTYAQRLALTQRADMT